jgi:hypothetical protein
MKIAQISSIYLSIPPKIHGGTERPHPVRPQVSGSPGFVHAAKAHQDCAILITFAVP